MLNGACTEQSSYLRLTRVLQEHANSSVGRVNGELERVTTESFTRLTTMWSRFWFLP